MTRIASRIVVITATEAIRLEAVARLRAALSP